MMDMFLLIYWLPAQLLSLFGLITKSRTLSYSANHLNVGILLLLRNRKPFSTRTHSHDYLVCRQRHCRSYRRIYHLRSSVSSQKAKRLRTAKTLF